MKVLRFVALVAFVVMLAALGCTSAGQETTSKEETTAAGEQTSAGQETTTTGGALTPSDTQDSGGNDLGKNILRCQLEEAARDTGGGTRQGQFVNEVFQQARERSVVPEQVLSEHGYDCGWSALQKGGGKG